MSIIRRLDQKDDIDLIILYLQNKQGEYELSPALEEKLSLMTNCRDLIREHGSRAKVVSMMVNLYDITRSKADRLYQDTMVVFNTTQTSHRDFWIDTAMGMFFETRKKALKDRDWRAAAAVESNIVKIIALMTDSKEAELYERLHVPERQIVFDPSITGVTLPDDWEERVNQLINRAHSKDLSDIPEAEVLPDDGEK